MDNWWIIGGLIFGPLLIWAARHLVNRRKPSEDNAITEYDRTKKTRFWTCIFLFYFSGAVLILMAIAMLFEGGYLHFLE